MIPVDMTLVSMEHLAALLDVAIARGEMLGYDSDDVVRLTAVIKTQLDECQNENQILQVAVAVMRERVTIAEAEAWNLKKQNMRMWELLQEAEDNLVVHQMGCTAYTAADYRCSCGCDAWLAKKEEFQAMPSGLTLRPPDSPPCEAVDDATIRRWRAGDARR